MHLIIDEGNTRIKLAVFDDIELIDLRIIKINDAQKEIVQIHNQYRLKGIIISSVTDDISKIVSSLEISNTIFLTNKTILPFKNLYKTPKTLGVDRLALICCAWFKFPKENTLVIDAGTCVTYDYMNKDGEYLGGGISPGLKMRFNSLHTFTKKLPDLEVPVNPVPLIGQSTKESIESGVLNGMVFEIDGLIDDYRQRFKKVKIILTGGDANFLYKQLKNSIFVNPNFLLEGLNSILTYQNKNEEKNK